MAAKASKANKKDKNETIDASASLASMVTKLDGVEMLTSSSVLNTRKKIRSSIEVINCLLGGGRPYGSVTGSFGPPSGGKSTEAYESAAHFLEQEPNGTVIIMDQESSADPSRLEHLGVDIEKIIRVKSLSIDSGFTTLIELLKMVEAKQLSTGVRHPVYVVWDTISKGRAEDTEESSRMDARNRARVIKSRMNDLNSWLDRLDIILVLLNQVIIEVDKHGNVKNLAGGGVALAHDEHLRLFIVKDTKTAYDPVTNLAIREVSHITLEKTKLSPKMTYIPMIFDISNGGKIDERESFITYFADLKLLESKGGYFTFEPLIEQVKDKFYAPYFKTFSGNKRSDTWINLIKTEDSFYLMLRLAFMDLVGDRYSLQQKVMEPYYNKLADELCALIPTLVRPVKSSEE